MHKAMQRQTSVYCSVVVAHPSGHDRRISSSADEDQWEYMGPADDACCISDVLGVSTADPTRHHK
jgi:hypothetical protein